MKRPLVAIVLLLGWASAAWSSAPTPLTTLSAIHLLTNAQAKEARPVVFEATVTCFNPRWYLLFVQDGDAAIYVKATTNLNLAPGDRVLIRGTTQNSFNPIVVSNDIALLRHDAVPKPIPTTFEELIRVQHDCMRVTVRARVLAADRKNLQNLHLTYLQMLTDGGYIDAYVYGDAPSEFDNLLDATVEVTGIAAARYDHKMQQTGALLHVAFPADVKVIKRPSSSPWSLAVTPMDQILRGYHFDNRSQRVRVRGTVTYYQPGTALVLQDGSRSLWITTQSDVPLHIGDTAEATGLPDVHNSIMSLTSAEVVDGHVQAPITPRSVSWAEFARSDNTPAGHHYDLISIEGKVVTEVRGTTHDDYVLVADGHIFSAIYHHAPDSAQFPLAPMKLVPVGSVVRVTGICVPYTSDSLNGAVAFDVLLRSFDDVVLVSRPSWLSVRNLVILVGLLLAIVIAVGVRGWAIEWRTRRQNAALAYIEQRRSRILEDIAGSRPLAEVVEQITELVSFKLRGAPCWVQIADGALLGNCPPRFTGLRVVQNEIPAHSGPALGTIFAAFDSLVKPRVVESEALSLAAGLAALAIETRRLYSDLRHRSEFDLLTDIHNRFSLDKHLDAQIEKARANAAVFGLVYIDLDGFKQVNDVYGHQVGDSYLQDVSLRMKGQLRTGDLLARVGGDEFAVLVPVVRNRADVEEIALRLEQCFDDPFAVEDQVLRGSASVGIAFYPEDGTTRDNLLSAADASMYFAKHTKRQTGSLAI